MSKKIAAQTVSIPATNLTIAMALQAIDAEFAMASKQVLNLTCAVCLAYVVDYTLVADDKARRKVDAITKDVKATIQNVLWARAIERYRKSFKVDGKTDAEVRERMEKSDNADHKPGQSTLELYLTLGHKLFDTLSERGHLAHGTGLVADIASSKTMKDAMDVLVLFMAKQEAKSANYYSAGVSTVDDLRVYTGGNPRGASTAPKPVAERVTTMLRVDPAKKAKPEERQAVVEAIGKTVTETTDQAVSEAPALILAAAEGIAKLASTGNQKALDALEMVATKLMTIYDTAHEASIKALQAQRDDGKSVVIPQKKARVRASEQPKN